MDDGTASGARGSETIPSPGARALRALVAAAVVALIAATAASLARADGDPASDNLLAQNVFLPYQQPSPQAGNALEQAANDVYLHGNRIKVAVILDAQDLGSIPSLFGQPSNYAQFLGLELGYWYEGPLLVVMPAGFGFYDGGRSTAAADEALQSLPVPAASPDSLAQAATTALGDLESAGALDSPDLRAPLVTAYPADGTRGKPATLRFGVYDDSGNSKALVLVYERHSLLATLRSPMAFRVGTRSVSVRWRVPVELQSRQLSFCVVATDPSGNRSKPVCAQFLRLR
jgi:hypothetical protein